MNSGKNKMIVASCPLRVSLFGGSTDNPVFVERYDNEHGGFGNAPKFPSPHNLIFLLRYYESYGEKTALNMVTKTLEKMRLGGIFDHIGFGFHRQH